MTIPLPGQLGRMRLPYVEALFEAGSISGAGKVLCNCSGRDVTWSVPATGPRTEIFLSAGLLTRVRDDEAQELFTLTEVRPLRELDAATSRQSFLRSWELQPRELQ